MPSKVMEVNGGHHMLISSKGKENDMYKLTYDSEDNDEINAPKTSPTQKQLSSAGYDTRMKIDANDTKENEKPQVSSPKQKKTKDVASYEGNGRFYSLFANDNFVTEDPKKRRKLCCCGVKSTLFIITIIVLLFAIAGLMWVVRGMQVQQDSMNYRLTKLEEIGIAASNSGPESESLTGSTGMNVPPPVGDIHGQCCTSNKERIDRLSDIVQEQSSKLDMIDTMVEHNYNEAEVRVTEITRVMMENRAHVNDMKSQMKNVKTKIGVAEKVANEAKQLANLALQDSELTESQIETYLESIGDGNSESDGNAIAFSVAHAMGADYVGDKGPAPANDGKPPSPFYDITSDFAPVISFTEEVIDDGDYIQPIGGTFEAPETGYYVIFVSFCVHSDSHTTVHLIRSGEILREMEIKTDSTQSPKTSLADLVAPPGFSDPQFFDTTATPSTGTSYIRPYQFSDVTPLDEGDTIHLRIVKGSIVEYTHLPGMNAAESCTRFSGYKL